MPLRILQFQSFFARDITSSASLEFKEKGFLHKYELLPSKPIWPMPYGYWGEYIYERHQGVWREAALRIGINRNLFRKNHALSFFLSGCWSATATTPWHHSSGLSLEYGASPFYPPRKLQHFLMCSPDPFFQATRLFPSFKKLLLILVTFQDILIR